MNRLEDILKNRYAQRVLINDPIPINSENQIKVLRYVDIRINTTPIVSVVVPVYNQEAIIRRNVEAILDHTMSDAFELIIVLDSCTDQTTTRLLECIEGVKHHHKCTTIIILVSSSPLFETAADNVGFLSARGRYILEIQADMTMTQPGYDLVLMKPFLHNSQVIGISGRCCHGIKTSGGIGKLRDVDKPLPIELRNEDVYYIAETCNRGPLMIDSAKLHQLGYLDEKNYFLDDSDHDLFARAYFLFKWVCGYAPIEWMSNFADGSTRKKRDPINQAYYQRYQLATNHGTNGFLNRFRLDKSIIARGITVVRYNYK